MNGLGVTNIISIKIDVLETLKEINKQVFLHGDLDTLIGLDYG